MDKSFLSNSIRTNKSFLCVGLDSDPAKIPSHLKTNEKNPVLTFNKAVIDATADYCVSYKPNLAFYEAMGPKGWEILQKTLEYIPKDKFTIADAKRGDIGNTARQYAKAFFEDLDFDAITLSPYMGRDAIEPFLEYPGKWAIVLGLTSNPGANDFQMLEANNKPLYAHVLDKVQQWGNMDNLMFVIGGTQPEALKKVREHCPDHFLLIPGIGRQGGDLTTISNNGLNNDYGLLVNASRSIIFAGSEKDFKEKITEKAKEYQKIMSNFI